MKIENIRINGIVAPMGYLLDHLSVSFQVTNTQAKAASYARIELLSEEGELLTFAEGDLDCAYTRLEASLSPRTRYLVCVYVKGDNGEEARGETFGETSKMNEAWIGRWISPRPGESLPISSRSEEDNPGQRGDAIVQEFHPVFEKRFALKQEVIKARLYIAGLGLYVAKLDEKRIGQEVLTPYFSDYHTEVQYQTFDVTELLRREEAGKGGLRKESLLSVELGNGWYKGRFGLQGKKNHYGSEYSLIAELHLTYADGSKEVIGTDESWTYRGADTLLSGIYDGEDIDHIFWEGKENPDRTPVLSQVEGKLTPRRSLPILEKETLPVKEVITTPAGETVLDFGQNFAGYVRFYANLRKGTKITLDFGEILQEGNFYKGNLRSARSQFNYVSGGEAEWVLPQFTYFGFRYVRVSGYPGPLNPSLFQGIVLYSDMEVTGSIETGHAKLNRLFQNALWGQKSNFLDLPTDCPQRDERLGWTGDAQVFSGTACYNMDTSAFYQKFCHDLSVEQGKLSGLMPGVIPVLEPNIAFSAVWGDIATFLPYTLYERYGDENALREEYPMMKAWVDYIDREDEKRGRQYLFNFSSQLGDWLALDGRTEQSLQGATDEYFIGSCYYALSAGKVAEAARILGYEEDAAHYEDLKKHIKEAVLTDYFTSTGRLALDTQTAYIVALYAGIYRDKQVIIDSLRERFYKDCFKIKGGFVGAPILCKVLAENGMYDEAFYFLLQEGYPGWLHCVDLGATTIWERWNSVLDNGLLSGTMMNSLNHYAFGSVMEYVYAHVAGIRPATCGFKKAILSPMPDCRLGHLKASYKSANGLYRSEWEIEEDGKLHLLFEIPFGCTARVELPYYQEAKAGNAEVKEELPAGVYEFRYQPTVNLLARYSTKTLIGDMWKDAKTQDLIRSTSPLLAFYLDTGNIDYLYENLTTLRRMFFMGFSKEEVDRLEAALLSLQ